MIIEGDEIRTLSNKDILRQGKILIKREKIIAVGKDIDVRRGVETAAGDIVVPSLIDAHTLLGICPIESTDVQPSGTDALDPVSPPLRVIDSINPFDKSLRDALSGALGLRALTGSRTFFICLK